MKQQTFTIYTDTYDNKTVTLTEEDIDDIMVSALEGGICYWCRRASVVGNYRGKFASDQISRGGLLKLYEAEGNEKWQLDRDSFLRGFQIWLEHGDDRYGAVQDGKVDPGEIDGEMADLIIQYALFGEIMFG